MSAHWWNKLALSGVAASALLPIRISETVIWSAAMVLDISAAGSNAVRSTCSRASGCNLAVAQLPMTCYVVCGPAVRGPATMTTSTISGKDVGKILVTFWVGMQPQAAARQYQCWQYQSDAVGCTVSSYMYPSDSRTHDI